MGGPEASGDRPSRPQRTWNRIPEAVRSRIVELALEEPELSPREVAVRFTDQESYFVSEASVYRLLKAHDLIASPAFIVVKAADEFHTKTTAPNQHWQTDFTYLKVIGRHHRGPRMVWPSEGRRVLAKRGSRHPTRRRTSADRAGRRHACRLVGAG
jgi:hypothetical protein